MKAMSGLIPASVTPFDKDGAFDPAALETVMRRNINEGACGFFSCGTSAECFLLSESERFAVFETACSFRNEAKIIAHVGAISTDEAIRYAKAAKQYGAQYISSTPPFYYGFTGTQIAQFFHDIADAAEMPVMIYNFPAYTGKSFDLSNPDICKLLRSGSVWGIKHTDKDLSLLERIRNLNPELVIMNGYDDTMVAGLALGADGSVGSMFNVMLPHFMKIYNEYHAGEKEKALELQVKANNIMEVFFKVGLIAAIKYTLQLQGINAGIPRKPLTPLTPEQMKMVNDALEL